jgi:hypothetical protein
MMSMQSRHARVFPSATSPQAASAAEGARRRRPPGGESPPGRWPFRVYLALLVAVPTLYLINMALVSAALDAVVRGACCVAVFAAGALYGGLERRP